MTANDHLTAIRQTANDIGIFSLWEGNSLYLLVEGIETNMTPVWNLVARVRKNCHKDSNWQKANGGWDVLKITITDI